MDRFKKFEQEYNQMIKEIHDGYDRMEQKVKDHRKFLTKAAKDFELMEAEERALKINPKLKQIIH